MPKGVKEDLAGRKFGKWTVLRDSGKRGATGCVIWECRCACGNVRLVQTGNLKPTPKSTQCSECGHKQRTEFCTTHGACSKEGRSPFYPNWLKSVKNDCVDAWRDFRTYEKDVQPRTANRLLKIDESLPFGPGNFKWSNRVPNLGKPQSVNGVSKTMSEWAETLGLTKERVRQLVEKHGTLKAALELRARKIGVSISQVIESHGKQDWARVMNKDKRGRKCKYPWSEWTNGETWTVNCKDYGVTVSSFTSALCQYAKKNGLGYKTRTDWDDENVVHFRFERN